MKTNPNMGQNRPRLRRAPLQIVNITQNSQRASFNRCLQLMKRKKVFTPNITPMVSYLSVFQPLSNNNTKYNFNIVESPNAETPGEKRLNFNDGFYATSIGVYLLQIDSTALYQQPLSTYPNETTFGAEVIGVYRPQDLEQIYYGALKVQVQSKVVLDNLDLKKMRKVNETQRTTATNKDQFAPGDGMAEITPELFFSGAANNKIDVEIPVPNGIAPLWQITPSDENKTNYLVLYMDGFLIKNISFNDPKFKDAVLFN